MCLPFRVVEFFLKLVLINSAFTHVSAKRKLHSRDYSFLRQGDKFFTYPSPFDKILTLLLRKFALVERLIR
ncbi:MAG: hypothetical protein AVDCRST_MAG74-1386 [uncultured Pyrinomonadaceae bacterium]|uniref:Uncharacterized protein n=1 Tax=uncultured Pyrinomonadaceae bacterium TaxID=2283094 RepID=A0A6J4NWV6_9BACT|nr:MAG: hypothetical protein AVDCRST_MAG74-1386 [uncultured Pyrinomonadaceae bacterium]